MNWNNVTKALARNQHWVIPAATGVVGFATGTLAGASAVLWKKNKQISSDLNDLVEMRQQLIRDSSKFDEEFETRVLQLADRIIYQQKASEYDSGTEDHPDMPVVVSEEPKRISIWTSHDEEGNDTWDWDEEKKLRNPIHPYVITFEEFSSNEMDFRQTTLTYYAADDVLTDEKDDIIKDVEATVGELKFGHGSHDQSICYIRNEPISSEFEVILDHGSFQVQVLGVDIEEELEKREIRHSAPKFRRE